MSQTTPEIDVERLERARSDGATVVDVREPGEYVVGHVPGSTPVQRLWRISEIRTR